MSKLIEIREVKPFSFEELFERLRKVGLKGVYDENGQPVRAYHEAEFEVKKYSPEVVQKTLFTPQPKVYTERLDFFEKIAEELVKQGFDHPCELGECYDYIAVVEEDNGEVKEGWWSMIPPVVEELRYPVTIDYEHLTRGVLPVEMELLDNLAETKIEAVFPTICDGDHRIYYAVKNGRPVKVVHISNIATGYPYYAFPQKYWKMELPTREHGELPENQQYDKIHIYPKEHEKKLYRLFPSGGIFSGDVRPDAKIDK